MSQLIEKALCNPQNAQITRNLKSWEFLFMAGARKYFQRHVYRSKTLYLLLNLHVRQSMKYE